MQRPPIGIHFSELLEFVAWQHPTSEGRALQPLTIEELESYLLVTEREQPDGLGQQARWPLPAYG